MLEFNISDEPITGIKRKAVIERTISDETNNEHQMTIYINRYKNNNGAYGDKLTDNITMPASIREGYARVYSDKGTYGYMRMPDGTLVEPDENGDYPEGAVTEGVWINTIITPHMLSVILNKPEWANINIPIGQFVTATKQLMILGLDGNGKFN